LEILTSFFIGIWIGCRWANK